MQLNLERERKISSSPSKVYLTFEGLGCFVVSARIFGCMHNNEYNTKKVYLCLIVCFADFRLVFSYFDPCLFGSAFSDSEPLNFTAPNCFYPYPKPCCSDLVACSPRPCPCCGGSTLFSNRLTVAGRGRGRPHYGLYRRKVRDDRGRYFRGLALYSSL